MLALTLTTTAVRAAETNTFTVRVTGGGRPMILIPGLACPGEVWDATVAHFADRFECHVLSLAGFAGASAATTEEPLLATVRADLARYIRDEKLDRPVIVGHSLGGFLALDLAARNPELPGALVLIDSLPFFMGVMRPGATAAEARQAADGMVGAFSRMDAEAYAGMIRGGPNGSTMAASAADLDRIIAWGLASDPATMAKAMTEMCVADLRPELARIRVPALALAAWVGYAPYSSHEFIEQTYRAQYAALAGARIEITDTARHFIMLDEPDWTFARIEAFLAATAAASPATSE